MTFDATTIVIVTTALTALSGIVLALINMRGQGQIQGRQLRAQQDLESSRFQTSREIAGSQDAQQIRNELRQEISDLRADNLRLRRENDSCLRNQIYLEGRLMNAESEINSLRVHMGMPAKPTEEAQIRMPAPQQAPPREVLRQRNVEQAERGEPPAAPPDELTER